MKLVCIKCPRGCELDVDGENITGNFCPRGIDYAREELTCPMRTVTALVKVKDTVVPVKTDKEVPKAQVFKVLEEIAKVHLNDTKLGQVILKNVAGTDANVIVTGNKYK
ncbi:MAG: DUF1667 domain-containing protein [Clostridiales bacterium]|nr:DUF1667 domain-containing protein [Clostridiales bacterium]